MGAMMEKMETMMAMMEDMKAEMASMMGGPEKKSFTEITDEAKEEGRGMM